MRRHWLLKKTLTILPFSRKVCDTFSLEDANLEDLLLKDNLWNVHESNIHALLIEIYKSINNLSPPVIKDFFD